MPESAPPTPPRARRWQFPLRIHIATLFLLVMTATGLAIIGYGYRATSQLLLSAGDEEFLHVSERTAEHVRNLLAPARLLAELGAEHRITRTDNLAARLELLPFWTHALTVHPEISAVYVGFDSGDFFLVRALPEGLRQSFGAPPDAAFLVQSVVAGDRPVPGRYLFVNAKLDVIRNEPRPEYKYDPRAREWYRRASASAALVRTDPYVFFTTREVGTTLAKRAPNGRAVVGVDITLQELSRHLAQSRVTFSSQLALVDRLGLVIAHPDSARLVRPGPTGEPGLMRLADLGEPVLGRLLVAPEGPVGGHVTLPLAGGDWVGVKRGIDMDAGESLILLLAAPRRELVADARGLAQWQVLLGFGVLGIALVLVWLSARFISRPLETLTRAVERMGGGDLDTRLPAIWNPLEVSALRDVTDHMRRMLRRHIEDRVARLAEEERRARELEIAKQIQLSMLPTTTPEPLAGCYRIAAMLQPAREVGGDLYDFFLLDGQRLILAIGDVADKGMPAALLMARVTGLVRALGRGDAGPADILRELDVRLSQGNDMCMFVTMACAILDETGELRLASAGHERPLLRRAGGATRVLVLEGGPALGLGTDAACPVWVGHLAPGDAVIFCTDGVTEAFDAAGSAFGLERFRSVVASTGVDSVDTLPRRVEDAIERFSAGGAARDDMAVVALQFRPAGVTVDMEGDETWRLSVASEPHALAPALRAIEGILRARGVPPAMIHDCVLASEELLANVMTHAYGGEVGREAHVEVRMPPEDIRIRIEDAGPLFDPFEAPEPDLEAPVAERPIGKLGLVLVQRLADHWGYARVGAANVHTLHWKRPAETGDGAFREMQRSADKEET